MNNHKPIDARAEIIKEMYNILEPWVPNSHSIDRVGEETNLITDLGLDSVAILNVVLGAEKKFGISIENQELDADVFSKIGNFAGMIQRKMHEASRATCK